MIDKLLQLPIGTLIIGLFVVDGMIKSSDITGVPGGLQFVGVFQTVLVAPVQVFDVPKGIRTVTVVESEPGHGEPVSTAL